MTQKTIEVYHMGALKKYNLEQIRIEPFYSSDSQSWGVAAYLLENKSRKFLKQIDTTLFTSSKKVYFSYMGIAHKRAMEISLMVEENKITRL